MSEEKENLKISDLAKKVISVGVGAAFMTEEAVKSTLADLSLPKDVLSGLISQAKEGKKDFVDNIKSEFKSYLNKVDLTKEIDKVLEKYDIEVNAKLSFKRKDDESSQ